MPSPPLHPANHREDLLEFEVLISDTSAALFRAPPEQCDQEIRRSLEEVRLFLEADRCALLEVPGAERIAFVRQIANGPGVVDVPTEINLAELFPWSWQRLVVERQPVRYSRVEDLPPEAAVELLATAQLGIRSTLTLPIETRGAVRHIILIQTIHRERDWPEVFVTRLRLLGELLVSALERSAMLRDLRLTEARLQAAADAADAGLWELDYATGAFWATPRARLLTGFSAGEPITIDGLVARIHPDDRQLIRDGLGDRTPSTIDYRVILPDGRVRWLSSTGRPVLGPTGEAVSVSGASIDVTARKAAAEALARSEGRLADAAELAGLGSYEVDFGAGVAHVDAGMREICGMPPEVVGGLAPVDFWIARLHPDDLPRILEARTRLHDGREPRLSVEYRFLDPARGERWIHHIACVSRRDAKGKAAATFGVLRDITDLKRADQERLGLSRRLLRAQEEERAMIARELHDDVTQRLAVLAIDAGRTELAAGDATHAASMRSLREGLTRLSEDVHALAYQLHSSVLEELGLAEALRTACERVARRGHLEVSSDLHPTAGTLGTDEALCLFRVAQEALRNVVRHAGACAARVTLQRMDGGVLLAVRDDGVGFDAAGVGTRRTLGLASMRERLRLVNGTLDVESAPGQGTAVVAWVPVDGGPR